MAEPSAMVERVAMAICGAGTQYACVCRRDARPPAASGGNRCGEALLEARAALDALRDPTHWMIDCMTPNLGIAEHAWRAGIDAALGDPR